MLFQKSIMSPHDKKMQEYANSQILNQQTMIEYIAVMSDIELPSEDPQAASLGDMPELAD